MTPEQVVQRARFAVNGGCLYGLGCGGYHPEDEAPWNKDRKCDCSGFASWALGISRWIQNDRHPLFGRFPGSVWVETSAVWRAAQRLDGPFVAVPWELAMPGDLLVWPDRKDDAGKQRQGHIGVVASIGPAGPASVVHCASSNRTDAIQETSPDLFLRRAALAVRYALLERLA